MAEYIQRLYQGQPDTIPGEELFDVPDSQACIVKHVEIINIEPEGGASDTITVWVLPPAVGSVADQYIWIPETELAPGERLTWGAGDSMCLEADCSVWAAVGEGATLTVINVLITGMLVDEQPVGT